MQKKNIKQTPKQQRKQQLFSFLFHNNRYNMGRIVKKRTRIYVVILYSKQHDLPCFFVVKDGFFGWNNNQKKPESLHNYII